MSLDLDRTRIRIECPKCQFPARPFFRQVKHRDVLVCGGCKSNIQLIDHLGSYRKSERQIKHALEELTSSLKNITIKIRL